MRGFSSDTFNSNARVYFDEQDPRISKPNSDVKLGVVNTVVKLISPLLPLNFNKHKSTYAILFLKIYNPKTEVSLLQKHNAVVG